jgi:hypothetical protein
VPLPLDGVALKIRRAREHFDELTGEIATFVQRNPYELVSHFDQNKGERGERIYRLVASEQIPPRISILIGESLQQLRSALDHIAWQLALLTTDKPPDTTEFPVFKDATGKRGYASKRNRKIGAIPCEAQAVIDGMQPHMQSAPKEDPLWVLHRLANDDKHRLPHIVSAIPHGVGVGRPPGVDLFVWLHYGPFDDNTEVAGVTIYPPSDPQMEVPVVANVTLCFDPSGPGGGRPVLTLLDEFGRGLDATVAAFQPFFR